MESSLFPVQSLDIRPYRAEDREAVFQIAADTAFFGEPVEHFLDDRRLFCDAFYRYYTDLEPEHGWVATANGVVAGFLMGCWDTQSRLGIAFRRIALNVAWKIVTGRYRIRRLTIIYVWGLLLHAVSSLTKGDSHSLDLTVYPAHLHINIGANYRGRGLGRCLMEAYLRQLQANGIPGVHLRTTNLNVAACKLYESMGFIQLSAHCTDLWKYALGKPVEDRIYVLRIFLP